MNQPKTVIVYESTHHKNTLKLVHAICEEYPIDTIDVTQTEKADLSGYELIGFASGISFSQFYKRIRAFAEECLPENKDVFLLYTCGIDKERFTESMKEIIKRKSGKFLGQYGCLGFDTFGPMKLIGGINKKNPTDEEIEKAVVFFRSIL